MARERDSLWTESNSSQCTANERSSARADVSAISYDSTVNSINELAELAKNSENKQYNSIILISNS